MTELKHGDYCGPKEGITSELGILSAVYGVVTFLFLGLFIHLMYNFIKFIVM